MTEHATTEDGVRVAYDVVGSGPAVVFVHGLGDDRTLWAPVTTLLEARFTCVVLDLRGHGETTGARDLDPFGLHRDLRSVANALGLTAPALVGHSLGGFAVTTYAARYPSAGIVIVDQPMQLRPLAAHVRSLRAALQGPIAPVLLEVLEAIGMGGLPPRTRERLRVTRSRLAREAVMGLWAPLLDGDDDALDDSMSRLLGSASATCLSIHGSDPPPSYAKWLGERMTDAHVEVWSGAGHFLHLVEPQRFAERLTTFLRPQARAFPIS
jgi:pimeloyl-ACP methyl ester carboxylesterase